MASDNKLELVVEVDVNKANASIKSINTGLSSMEQAAGKAARGSSAGIDGLTVSLLKMPSAKDVFEYRRGFAHLLDLPFGRQEVTINIGSAAALYKNLLTATKGYA